ncbi:MAG: hypothetical protein QOE66_2427, partial [Chloroflexota bacterium]|nr:hypothetical protein [Chloroflexota bacterium]
MASGSPQRIQIAGRRALSLA